MFRHLFTLRLFTLTSIRLFSGQETEMIAQINYRNHFDHHLHQRYLFIIACTKMEKIRKKQTITGMNIVDSYNFFLNYKEHHIDCTRGYRKICGKIILNSLGGFLVPSVSKNVRNEGQRRLSTEANIHVFHRANSEFSDSMLCVRIN